MSTPTRRRTMDETPPECQTDAEKTAYAFGYFKALEKKREWVGLTDEDIDLYAFDEGVTDNKAPAWLVTYARGIEAKLKEKNGL